MNVVILKGNLARDPEVRAISVGEKQTKVANFTIAVSRFFSRKDGSPDKATEFIRCEAWDSGAESIEKLLSKGDPVLIQGSLKTESWEQEDGQKRSVTKVRVAKFDKLQRAPKRDPEPSPTTEKLASVADVNTESTDEIPF